MAKRRKAGSYIVGAAGSLGSAVGHVAGRLDAWKKERQELVKHLREVVADAQSALNELGHEADDVADAVRKTGRQKGYKMSPETKAKLRAAWKKRKGDVEHDVKVVRKIARTMSAEARARISAAQKKRWAAVKRG